MMRNIVDTYMVWERHLSLMALQVDIWMQTVIIPQLRNVKERINRNRDYFITNKML